jgi:hypothetical protein
MCEVPTASLQRLVRDVYGCGSAFVAVVPVVAKFGKQSRLLAVTVLRLLGHETAKHCYAWSHRIESTIERQHYVLVLEDDLVKTPEAAVKASIASAGAESQLRVA